MEKRRCPKDSGKLVLYFYPKDMTPGCTLEGQDFRDLHAAFKRAKTTVLGVSKDSCERHAKFRAKEKFPFELLSDEDEKVCRLFDVIREKSLYGRKFMGIERSTFLIDDKRQAGPRMAQGPRQGPRGRSVRGGQVTVTAKRAAGGKPAIVNERRLFVLDTNVLMHDPTAIFRFQEHDVYLPMVVLEELDSNKKGLSEASRNVRQTSRFLDDLMRDATKDQIDAGLPLPSAMNGPGSGDARATAAGAGKAGRLFFQTRQLTSALPDYLPGHGADNAILAQTLALQALHHEARVTLVSKDINLRIKAAVVGVHAEDYYSDKTIEDADVLYTGLAALPADFWEKARQGHASPGRKAAARSTRSTGPIVADLHVNQFVHEAGEAGIEAIVRRIEAGTATLELARDFRGERHSVWGVNARNREQNFALNLLMDPEIDFVTILGPAGTGKTLLTLAAGLMQTLESNRFVEIIMTRVTIPLGEDIGFLPGTEEEKMEPWMGALMDNLEVLTQDAAKAATGAAPPPTTCCATASRSARSTSCAAARS